MGEPRDRISSMRVHWMLLTVGLLFNFAALLLLWWDGAKTPYVSEGFSYSADISVSEDAYDTAKSQFFGVRYSQAQLNIEPLLNGDTTKVKTTYIHRDGAEPRAFTRERVVDVVKGTYTDAVSSESILAPRDVTIDSTFYFTPPGTDTPLLMKFASQEVIGGVAVLRFMSEQKVPIATTDTVPLKPGETFASQETFEMWVEPASGWPVKFKDRKVQNVYAADGSVSWPVKYIASVSSPQSVDQHAAYAKSLRTKRHFVTQVGPSAFITVAILALMVVSYARLKRRKTLVLAVGNAVIIAVSFLVIVGWVANVMPLKTFFLGTTAMNPISAFCFLLVGLAVLAKRNNHARIVAALGLSVGVISLLQLLSSLGAIGFAPDLLILGRAVLELDATMPSRMSSYMSFALLVLSSLIIVLGVRREPPMRFARFVVALTLMLGVLGVIFNATQLDAVFTLPFVRGLSLVGSCGLIVIALICALLLYGMIGRADNMLFILRSLRWPALIAVPVVVIGVFAQLQQRAVQSDLAGEFDDRIVAMETAFSNRFLLYENSLYGARALLVASQEVTAQEWHDYTVAYHANPEAVPLKTLGYAVAQSPDEAIVKYAETQSGSLVGTNLHHDAAVSEVLKASVSAGEIRMSGNIATPPEVNSAELMLVVPVYKKGAAVSSVQQRIAAVEGYVFGTIDFSGAVRAAAGQFAENINIRVYGGTDVEKNTIMYTHKLNTVSMPRLSKQKIFFVDGQALTVIYEAEQGFRLTSTQEVSPTAILLGGNAIYFGLIMGAYLLTDMNKQRRDYERIQKEKR